MLEGGDPRVDLSRSIVQTRMIDLTAMNLRELVIDNSRAMHEVTEAVVQEVTSRLLVSVAGHDS
jgi:hypothetical protein